MAMRMFTYGGQTVVRREPDGMYSITFANAGDAVRVVSMGRTDLTNLKRQINEILKETKR